MRRLARLLLTSLLLAIAVCTACATPQDASTAFPQNYRVVLDNPDISVLRVHYGPHEAIGVHDHSDHPTVYVYLNDSGPVRFVHEPERIVLTRPPTHTGSFRVSPGRPERHSLVNLSDRPSEYLRIEMKRIPLGTLKREFRSAGPEPPLIQGRTVEFEDPQLRIERVICNADAPCPLPASDAPSLAVAFTPVRLRDREGSQALTIASPVLWLRAGEAASGRSSARDPVHLLRIYLLTH